MPDIIDRLRLWTASIQVNVQRDIFHGKSLVPDHVGLITNVALTEVCS